MLPVAELSEQAVLITGAGRGLGRAIAVRLGHEGDVAAATIFLPSAAVAFINGEILHIDGGIAAAG